MNELEKQVATTETVEQEVSADNDFLANSVAEGQEVNVENEENGKKKKFSSKKSSKKEYHLPTRKLCGMAVLAALAVTLACTVHIPYLPPASFLEYSPSDVPVLIASFMYGPVAGLVITVIVSVIQGLTVSLANGGPIGILMNFVSTGVYVLTAGIIYKYKRNLKGAIIGLIAGIFVGTGVMIAWNLVMTPTFMGAPRSAVIALLPASILPFNLIKYTGNAGLTFILYKATGKLFKLAFSKVPDKSIDDDLTDEELFSGKEIVSKSMEDTARLAEHIASTLKGGEVILLNGDLGAGKTTFTKGLAVALGIKDEVTSPTFTIMNVYDGEKHKLNHLDMYRIEHEDDLYELGVEDAMSDDTITVIEWNKLTSLGDNVITINIKVEKEKRIFTVSKNGTDTLDCVENTVQCEEEVE